MEMNQYDYSGLYRQGRRAGDASLLYTHWSKLPTLHTFSLSHRLRGDTLHWLYIVWLLIYNFDAYHDLILFPSQMDLKLHCLICPLFCVILTDVPFPSSEFRTMMMFLTVYKFANCSIGQVCTQLLFPTCYYVSVASSIHRLYAFVKFRIDIVASDFYISIS